MQVYTVEGITEADYGCEETRRKEPMALLKLIKDAPDPEEKYVEVTEATLAKQKISEGKKVCFTKDGSILKYIRVVAAVIRDDDKIFATARGYGEYKGWWEFPGGKVEDGETLEEALVRELREEMDVEIKPDRYLRVVDYDYPEFHIKLHCFLAKIVRGEPKLLEHDDARWVGAEELGNLKWLDADWEIVNILGELLSARQ